MKENIIIVGDFNRIDFLYVAKVMCEHYNIYFLEFIHKGEIKSGQYTNWGKAIFWGDYKNALELVDQIKPRMVLFHFIETFNHVALNVTCKYRAIKTYHIEHGIRNYEMLATNINQITRQNKVTANGILNKIKNIRSRIKGRLFFQNTVNKLPQSYSLFLREYFRVRSQKTVFETFRAINNPLRVADSYISFSPKIYEFHQESDHLPTGYPVHFIGCPSFDYLAEGVMSAMTGQNILFVDNAFESQNLFGWNEEKKIRFLEQLACFAERQHRKLWVKPHPYANEMVYHAVKEWQHVRFIEKEEVFKKALSDCKIIIGFYSTLLMPLMALEHTVCFSLEMHPAPLNTEASNFLVQTGVTKRINSWEQLRVAFESLDTIYQEQKGNKKKFIEDWLYKFDGRATERLKNILVNEAS